MKIYTQAHLLTVFFQSTGKLPNANAVHLSDFFAAQKEKKQLAIYLLSILFIFMSFNLSSQSVPMLRLKMSGLPNYLDETIIYYQSGATDGFDSQYDAYKSYGSNATPYILQEHDSIQMVVNGIAPVAQTFSMSIKTITYVTGNFTITASDFAGLPSGTCVYLDDIITGTRVNILTNPYVFNLSDTTTTNRFVLTITHYELPFTSSFIQPTCQNINAAKFKAQGSNFGPWNYVWKDSTGVIIKSTMASLSNDSLININSGNYTLEMSSASNTCYYATTTFFINKIILPQISFYAPDTLYRGVTPYFAPTNQSVNCTSYLWNFGDGVGNSTNFDPQYSYSAAGQFTAKLVGISSTGCKDSSEKHITIIDLATIVKNETMQPINLLNLGDNNFMIKLNSSVIDQLEIAIYDLEGKNLLTERKEKLKETDQLILNLNYLKHGMYIATINTQHKKLTTTKLIIN